MDRLKFQFIALYFIFVGLFCINNAKIQKNNSFVATDEWQEIPENMAIPAGLHVRINFQTRKREAKLLNKSEEHEDKSNAVTLKDNPGVDSKSSDVPKKKILLSDALKNFQKDGGSLKYSPENLSKIKRDFKAAREDFANDFENMRKHFQSDAEILTLLIEEYLNITSSEQKNILAPDERSKRQAQILDSFDYMLHQIDNSILFMSQGGLHILLPIVANETRPLRIKAMRVLGVLTQNNPTVQNEVFKQNFPTYLLKTLISSTNTEELSAALYAFGSLIRKLPLAQRNLLSTSGTQALVAVINRECELKVKIKAITIISDILEEYHYMLSSTNEEISAETLIQYKDLKLHEWLQANEFCEAIESLILKEGIQFFDQPDLFENLIDAIGNANSVCRGTWSQNTQMQNTLLAIKSQYELSGDDYRNEVSQRVSELVLELQNRRHEEL